MPHVIDRETGLCSVCKRREIAAIKEGRKYNRLNYDVRKTVIENITHKSDPNYRAITDRHYIKYNDNQTYSSSPRESYYNELPKAYASPVPTSYALDYNYDDDSDDDEIKKIQSSNWKPKYKTKEREKLRKVYTNFALFLDIYFIF